SKPIHGLGCEAVATALASGQLTSTAVVQALHARTAAVDADLRGYLWPSPGPAAAAAAQADRRRAEGRAHGALDGVPVSVKDNFDLEGAPTTLGIAARQKHRAEHDADLVAQLRAAGMVLLGKSNVPQSLMAMETDNAIVGRAANPWNPQRSAGGSSGGEAVLLASGQSPLGLGSDIGGSVRIPAAYCGLSALKPTVGRLSSAGMHSALGGQDFVRATPGFLARSSGDLGWFWLQLAALPAVATARGPLLPPAFWASHEPPLSTLRVGFYDSDGDLAPSGAVRRALSRARAALEDAGVTLVSYVPSDAETHYPLYVAGLTADGLRTPLGRIGGEALIAPIRTNVRLARLPKAVRLALSQLLDVQGEARLARALRRLGEKSVTEYWALCAERQALAQAEHRRWQDLKLDALLCPATATPAPRHGESHDFTAAVAYTARYNLIDRPAGVVPAARVTDNDTPRDMPQDRIERRAQSIETDATGLPVGVQVVGQPWQEVLVLRLMAHIEQACRAHDDFPRTPVS
ncbi:MAG: amidase, partial [Polyangiales bacterium]